MRRISQRELAQCRIESRNEKTYFSICSSSRILYFFTETAGIAGGFSRMRLAQVSCAIAGIGGLADHLLLCLFDPKEIELESTRDSSSPRDNNSRL